ncbi:stage IV sporulation protein FB [Sporolactobacillus shoreae]|uniref:Stage IV sporulation protein FB n=1 Tax=Sporolactobacillus shoreae TaxID=1465501 RepID=A0A4Z0GRL1_9BACL|nr:M50 family metallopeptidase [Sporolactobacillus shoreae]TGA99490.1 stage IV sporulation protein FB [Sporolactobacillus shoreae]
MISFLYSKISIHPVFWLVIAAGMFTGHLWETVIAFAIVLIHECGHAVAAYRMGWKVEAIELLPFGGVAKIDESREHPFWQECIVVLAGPFQNVCLLFLGLLVAPGPFWGMQQQEIFYNQNMAILLFNLLPIWPLDGGRLLHLYLERLYPFKLAYKRTLLFSLMALLSLSVVMVLFYPLSVNLWVVISFIALSIYKERQVIPLHFMRFLLALSARAGPSPKIRHLFFEPDTSIVNVFSMFYKHTDHRIHVEGKKDMILDDRRLASAYFKGFRADGTLEDCSNTMG